MALSACFGGPMLNILLGIGLSGVYMTVTKGEHRHERHPDRPVHFAPYHIAVSTTLVISGATLLFTLAGLLVAVPMRRWKMDKTIGWGLVVLWCVSTAVNVLVEVLGFSSDVS
jgi:sodium/potassium/calcium exchanger 6